MFTEKCHRSHDQAVLFKYCGGLLPVDPSTSQASTQPPGQLEAVALTLQQPLHVLPHLHLAETWAVVLTDGLLLLPQTFTKVLLLLNLPLVQLPVN